MIYSSWEKQSGEAWQSLPWVHLCSAPWNAFRNRQEKSPSVTNVPFRLKKGFCCPAPGTPAAQYRAEETMAGIAMRKTENPVAGDVRMERRSLQAVYCGAGSLSTGHGSCRGLLITGAALSLVTDTR